MWCTVTCCSVHGRQHPFEHYHHLTWLWHAVCGVWQQQMCWLVERGLGQTSSQVSTRVAPLRYQPSTVAQHGLYVVWHVSTVAIVWCGVALCRWTCAAHCLPSYLCFCAWSAAPQGKHHVRVQRDLQLWFTHLPTQLGQCGPSRPAPS